MCQMSSLCVFVSIGLLLGFVTSLFSQGEVVSLTPNPQSGGPGYPLLSGPSPSTCPAKVALPVANATADIALRIIWPCKPSHPALAFGKVQPAFTNALWVSALVITNESMMPECETWYGDS